MKDYHFGIYCYTDRVTENIVYISARWRFVSYGYKCLFQ